MKERSPFNFQQAAENAGSTARCFPSNDAFAGEFELVNLYPLTE